MTVLLIIPFLIALGFLVITVVVIVNIINNPKIDSNNKLFWIVLILVTNILGLIIYLVVQDKNVLKWAIKKRVQKKLRSLF